jgi:hypothetical protein
MDSTYTKQQQKVLKTEAQFVDIDTLSNRFKKIDIFGRKCFLINSIPFRETAWIAFGKVGIVESGK